MITSDAELEVVRRQLEHVDAALDDVRSNILPRSEQMYYLMAESYMDMRQSIQADIDAYFGIDAPPRI